MRLLSILLIAGGVILSNGCSMCATGYLDDYATVGGKWQRSDPTQGRVGSIFSDAGETVSSGAFGEHMVDNHSAGIEGEVFGEAYTENYSEGMEEFHELGDMPAENEFFEMPGTDGELMLGDEW